MTCKILGASLGILLPTKAFGTSSAWNGTARAYLNLEGKKLILSETVGHPKRAELDYPSKGSKIRITRNQDVKKSPLEWYQKQNACRNNTCCS
jgi:hypothetical protein